MIIKLRGYHIEFILYMLVLSIAVMISILFVNKENKN